MIKEPAKILVVDDDTDILLTAEIVLKQKFSHVKTIEHPSHLTQLLKKETFSVILLDMNYVPGDNSGKEGLKWIDHINKNHPEIKIVVITAYGDMNIAVEAMKRGAIDFVTKPWEYEKIQATVMNAYKLGKNEQQIAELKTREISLKQTLKRPSIELQSNSPRVRKIYRTLEKVAITDANVLILGENGTGKSLIAQAIHNISKRSEEVFMSVDLGALSTSLFESELFGHKKGAFTDAREDRVGRFESANDGTLFLDEIGNLDLGMQAKLLTVLQQGEITRIGENQPKKFDVRIVAATNRGILQMIEEATFREDLYYRLNTIEIELPPLRERLEDLEMLLTTFVEKFCKKYQKPSLKIGSNLVDKLSKYSWPGNIRELEHATERAIILSESNKLESDDFLLKKSPKDMRLSSTNLEELEEITIRSVIDKHDGNMSKVAKELGIGRTTLYRKLEKYGL